jgi:carbon starvation protein
VNTLWPLFGISNQMLAAVALVLCTVVIFRMKRERYAWVTIVPTAWLAICTLTAGLEKILHPDPRIGFLSHATRYSDALAQGQVLAPAKDLGQMSQIVWNDRIDAALSALFVFVVLSILFYGVRSCLDAFRADRWTALETTTSRDPASMAAGEVASAMR